ncbi:transcription and mRNA export factor ENY2-like [Vespula squamosa]|uniref:Transcription and mRNA export factor ENY2-like n=1 Tax=Vespula squamosa TaxID=30214 RepID=A0ABD2BN36_VESSQ
MLDQVQSGSIRNNNKFQLLMKTAPHQRLVMVGDRDGQIERAFKTTIGGMWMERSEHGHDITYDTLLSMVTSKARTLVPDSVKKELLQKIKNQLVAQEEKLKM